MHSAVICVFFWPVFMIYMYIFHALILEVHYIYLHIESCLAGKFQK